MADEFHEELRAALKQVAALLREADVPYALAGSYALWVRGAPETDHDVDFVLPEEYVKRAADELSAAGLAVTQPPEGWLVKVASGDVVVDLLHHAAGEPIDDALLARAKPLEVLSVEMPVLDPTDVLSAKLRSLSEHSCDFGALLPAVRAVREQVDWSRLRHETAGNDFAVAFLVLTDRLGISPTV